MRAKDLESVLQSPVIDFTGMVVYPCPLNERAVHR